GTAGGPYTVTATSGGKNGTAAVAVTLPGSGPVAHWMLDETSGVKAVDASGNGHTGTLASAMAWTNGVIGGAVRYTSTYKNIAVSPVVDIGAEWTIAGWFTMPLPASSYVHKFVSDSSGAAPISVWHSTMILGVSTPTFVGSGYNLSGLSAGWHHLTGVASGTTTVFYVDGAYVGTSPAKLTSEVAMIGNSVSAANAFSDAMDDVRVYNRVLSASEVAVLAGGTVNPDENTNGLPDAWEVTNFGATNAVEGGAQDDYDHDGMNNLSEYIAGTCPTNAADLFKIADATPDGSSSTGMVIRWSSVAGKWYAIQTATNLMSGFDGWAETNIPATPSINTYTVIVDQIRSRYYRVMVE
ncbi:MAG: LamG domain-containing protein, partial [Kiritimatiellae bacterium]|nr:LamG domain-containing protein [Kiritimatiellia bacterium]